MKNWFEMMWSWLSGWNHGDVLVDAKTGSVSEQERRLREMQDNGRMLFLP